jgi:hypothetical protein
MLEETDGILVHDLIRVYAFDRCYNAVILQESRLISVNSGERKEA